MKIDVKTEVRQYSISEDNIQESIKDLTGEIAMICSGIRIYRSTVGELINPDANKTIAEMPEYELKSGEELILYGAIESGMPLTFINSKENKITTKPVTYIKIEP